MNEQDIQDILVALLTEDSVQLGECGAEEGAEPTFEAISTFEEAGIASDDKGLVISAGDGSAFLVTIEQRSGEIYPLPYAANNPGPNALGPPECPPFPS